MSLWRGRGRQEPAWEPEGSSASVGGVMEPPGAGWGVGADAGFPPSGTAGGPPPAGASQGEQSEASVHHPGPLPPPVSAGLWRPIELGPPLPAFDVVPPGGLSYRPDTVSDGWCTPALYVRLASVRGYQHRFDGRPREDDAAVAYEPTTGTVTFAVADGVSAAKEPHIGSQLACRSAVDEMLSQVRQSGGVVTDWGRLLSTVHWQLIEQARRLLRQPEAGAEEAADLLATTLIAGTATPTPQGIAVDLLSVGDSGAWQIKHDRIYSLTGTKWSESDELVNSAVQPLPYIPAVPRPMHFGLHPGTVLLVGTDGFGDPLGDGRGEVAERFVAELRQPVPALGLAHLLDFHRETFDDDRTLVVLWPRYGVAPQDGLTGAAGGVR